MAQVERLKEEKRDRQRTSVTTTDAPAEWVGFADVELTSADKTALKKLADNYGDAWEEIMSLVLLGYKMTYTYDEKHTTHNLSLTARKANDTNAGLTLTGRGGSLQGATMALWYKHVYMLERNWQKARSMQKGKMDATDVG